MARISLEVAGSVRVLAFLDMIKVSELGPKLIAASDDGYNVLVGSTWRAPKLFKSYAKHPGVFVKLRIRNPTTGEVDEVTSSAAGGYQFLLRTWARFADKLQMVEFTPVNQDRACIAQLREVGALDYVVEGTIAKAVDRARKIWASLPGAGYGQPENKLADLVHAYEVALDGYRKNEKPDFSNVVAAVETTAPLATVEAKP